MKLIIAVVQQADADLLNNELLLMNVASTKLASTGTYQQEGFITFLIGIEESRLEDVLEIIDQRTHRRNQFISAPILFDSTSKEIENSKTEISVGGAHVFVVDVDKYFEF